MKWLCSIVVILVTWQAQAPPLRYWIKFSERSADLENPRAVRNCVLVRDDGAVHIERMEWRDSTYYSGQLTKEEVAQLRTLATHPELVKLQVVPPELTSVRGYRSLEHVIIRIWRGDHEQELELLNVDGQTPLPEQMQPIRGYLSALAKREFPKDDKLKNAKVCVETERRGPQKGRKRITP